MNGLSNILFVICCFGNIIMFPLDHVCHESIIVTAHTAVLSSSITNVPTIVHFTLSNPTLHNIKE